MKTDSSRYHDPWMAQLYDCYSAGRMADRDVALWTVLAGECGGPVLELACGTGRVVLPLARAGFEVTGLDLSPHMLAVARRKLSQERQDVQARVRLAEGDMRNFALEQTFGLILIPNRSFQILLEREEQRRCIECCAAHLRPGGRLAIDVFNVRHARLAAPGGVDEKPHEYAGSGGVTVRETGHADYDVANQRLLWHARYECTAAAGAVTVREYDLALRYFFRFEVEWMLEGALQDPEGPSGPKGGFEVEALYGDFDRSPFAADSPEMIFIARRPR